MAMGSNIGNEELTKGSERIWNLGRVFNVMAGFCRKDDTLPERLFTDPLPEGPLEGKVLPKKEFEAALSEYYHLRGWNQEGIPSKQRLEEIRVDKEAIEKFEKYLSSV